MTHNIVLHVKMGFLSKMVNVIQKINVKIQIVTLVIRLKILNKYVNIVNKIIIIIIVWKLV